MIYASAILRNYFSSHNEDIPTTLRTTFLRAGELKIIPDDLAKSLSEAAAMRNILVHTYTKIDLKIIYKSIGPALNDFSEFITIMSQKVNLIEPEISEAPPEETLSEE